MSTVFIPGCSAEPGIAMLYKYRINNASFTSTDESSVKNRYAALIKYLLNKTD